MGMGWSLQDGPGSSPQPVVTSKWAVVTSGRAGGHFRTAQEVRVQISPQQVVTSRGLGGDLGAEPEKHREGLSAGDESLPGGPEGGPEGGAGGLPGPVGLSTPHCDKVDPT